MATFHAPFHAPFHPPSTHPAPAHTTPLPTHVPPHPHRELCRPQTQSLRPLGAASHGHSLAWGKRAPFPLPAGPTLPPTQHPPAPHHYPPTDPPTPTENYAAPRPRAFAPLGAAAHGHSLAWGKRAPFPLPAGPTFFAPTQPTYKSNNKRKLWQTLATAHRPLLDSFTSCVLPRLPILLSLLWATSGPLSSFRLPFVFIRLSICLSTRLFHSSFH